MASAASGTLGLLAFGSGPLGVGTLLCARAGDSSKLSPQKYTASEPTTVSGGAAVSWTALEARGVPGFTLQFDG
jgi:hypothetical protein